MLAQLCNTTAAPPSARANKDPHRATNPRPTRTTDEYLALLTPSRNPKRNMPCHHSCVDRLPLRRKDRRAARLCKRV
jgi:hypothetical protein